MGFILCLVEYVNVTFWWSVANAVVFFFALVFLRSNDPTQQTHPADAENAQCPVCGYYCLGKGGHGCIDKPGMLCKTCEDFRATEQTGRCPSCGQPVLIK